MKFNVHIAQFPGNNSTHPDVGRWLIKTAIKMKADPRIGRIGDFCKADTPIPMLRNLAIVDALEGGYDYCLMIDSDMSPDYLVGQSRHARPFWDVAWEFMMNRRCVEQAMRSCMTAGGDQSWEKPDKNQLLPATICAPYCGPPPFEVPYIFRWKNMETGHPNPDFSLKMIDREDAAVRSGIEQFDALPTGLILYDLRLFKKLPPPWFQYEYENTLSRPSWWEGEWPDDGVNFEHRKCTTEDVFQTRNASMLQFPQFVAWDCWAVHNKLKRVGKPEILTREAVRGTMQKALASKVSTAQERIFIVNPYDPAVVGVSNQEASAPVVGTAGRNFPCQVAGNGNPDIYCNAWRWDGRLCQDHCEEAPRGSVGNGEADPVIPAMGGNDYSCNDRMGDRGRPERAGAETPAQEDGFSRVNWSGITRFPAGVVGHVELAAPE